MKCIVCILYTSLWLLTVPLSPLHTHTRDRERALAQSLAPPILPLAKADMPRFTGGGFNLKQSQKAIA